MMQPAWLSITRGDAPLVVSLPHTGTDLAGLESRLHSEWLARADCDWWINHLYDFAAALGATVIHTSISRTVIDVNRDPSGVSLYPGQITTTLCPADTFEGRALYRDGHELTDADIAARRATWFDPYHAAIVAELDRLRAMHRRVVIYDCHSIRSILPRLFDGKLPEMNLGTNEGRSCDPELEAVVARLMENTGRSYVVNGRFKGGYITRHYGRPPDGVHALQMELACRAYMREPSDPSHEDNLPAPYDAAFAAPIRAQLTEILTAARNWAQA
jgi:N-formylglutamate deformylase